MMMMMMMMMPRAAAAGMMPMLLMLADRQTGRSGRTEFGSVGTWQIIYSLHDVVAIDSVTPT